MTSNVDLLAMELEESRVKEADLRGTIGDTFGLTPAEASNRRADLNAARQELKTVLRDRKHLEKRLHRARAATRKEADAQRRQDQHAKDLRESRVIGGPVRTKPPRPTPDWSRLKAAYEGFWVALAWVLVGVFVATLLIGP